MGFAAVRMAEGCLGIWRIADDAVEADVLQHVVRDQNETEYDQFDRPAA